jgi:putative DNA primase/helicase
MLALAATESRIALDVGAMDADPFLLACPNGTLDLRTGRVRAHNPSDLISRGTAIPYDAGARCPRWLHFLREVFDGDDDLISFVHRAVGYSLAGDTREQVLFVCHGYGANGKSVFRETVSLILGDLAVTAAFDTFLRGRGDHGPRNDIARLHRARFVAASESGSERRLDEALVKALTGEDTVAARFLYGEHFEFKPEFKIWLFTNHLPRVEGDDDAIWRRIRLVPFSVSFMGKEDRNLGEALAEEAPGILAWAVEGCLDYQRNGLGLPPAVAQATKEYREDEDILSSFIAERCIFEGSVEAARFRTVYEQFCFEVGERPLSASALGRALSKRGISGKRRADGRIYRGIRLQSNPTFMSDDSLTPSPSES